MISAAKVVGKAFLADVFIFNVLVNIDIISHFYIIVNSKGGISGKMVILGYF